MCDCDYAGNRQKAGLRKEWVRILRKNRVYKSNHAICVKDGENVFSMELWVTAFQMQRANGRVHPDAEAAITKHSLVREVKCLNLILSQGWRLEGHDQVTVLQ